VPDLRALAQKLSLQRSGALLSVPVAAQGQPVLQVLMLAPFSGRRWSQQDQAYLIRIAAPLAQILQRNQQMSQIQAELAQSRQALQALQDQAARVENDRTKLIELVSLLQHKPDGSPEAVSDTDKGNQGNGA
jgi:GAF domain-containing protein